MKLEHSFIPHIKLNSWAERLYYNTWRCKTPRRKPRHNILRHKLQQCFPRSVSKGKQIRAKKYTNWTWSNFKAFCTAKEVTNEMKRQPTEWKKIRPRAMTDKGLISKINQTAHTTQGQKHTSNPIWTQAEALKRHFSQEDIQVVNRGWRMLNIAKYKRDASQNCKEGWPHTGHNSGQKKIYKQLMPKKAWRKGSFLHRW